jgi:hypothetical protein
MAKARWRGPARAHQGSHLSARTLGRIPSLNSLAGSSSWGDGTPHGIARIGGDPVGALRGRYSAIFGGSRCRFSEAGIRTRPGGPGASLSGCKGNVEPMLRRGRLRRVGIPANSRAVTQGNGGASIRLHAECPHAFDPGRAQDGDIRHA